MSGFEAMAHADIAAFVEAHAADLGADLTADYVHSALASGAAVIEAMPFGFAIVQLSTGADASLIPHLLVFFVAPEKRGQKLGHFFMRELIGKYAKDNHMSLYCAGPARRRFYGRLGFVVESRDGEMRLMTTNRERR
jgi:GNAT superfamily N-acetyltransferase